MAALLPLFLFFSLLLWRWSRRCRRLRHQRLQRIATLYAADPLPKANPIIAHALYVEFPFLNRAAIELALLRTFAIPSISALLRRTAQFSASALHRYDDTDLLVTEMLLHHSQSPRAATAIRRINFLHSNYPSITNHEYLYVLSLFMVYPIQFCNRYGHRHWTPTEERAYFSVWRDIGAKMGIVDLHPSLSAAADFKERYESEHMIYADSNAAVADPTMDLILADFPAFLRPLARRLALAMMDDRLLAALGYPSQPIWLRTLVRGALKLCSGVFVAWFMPPRSLHKAVLRIAPFGCPAAPPETADGARFPVMFRRFRSQRGQYEENGYRIEELGTLKPGRLASPPDVAFSELLCPFSPQQWPASLFGDETIAKEEHKKV